MLTEIIIVKVEWKIEVDEGGEVDKVEEQDVYHEIIASLNLLQRPPRLET